MSDCTKYWFFFESSVYIEKNDTDVFICELFHQKKFEYRNCRNLINFIEAVIEKNYVMEVDHHTLFESELSSIIKELRENYICDYIDIKLSSHKPVQLFPTLRIMNGFNTFSRERKNEELGKDIQKILRSVDIFINEECELDCRFCQTGYKQIMCCKKSTRGNEMPLVMLKKIFKQLQHTSCRNIKVTGGNIFRHSQINEIIHFLNTTSFIVRYYMQCNHFLNNKSSINSFNKINSSLAILIQAEDIRNSFKEIQELNTELLGQELNHSFVLIVSDQETLEFINDQRVTFPVKLMPVLDNNLDFFKKNLFVDKDKIMERKIERKELYKNRVINTNFWGNFKIDVDLKVYSSFCSEPIGNVRDHRLKDLILKELQSKSNWIRTRNDHKKCKTCLYKYICAPVSNYELLLEQTLCHV
jgi:pseudo-rSAM protein